MLGGVNLAGSRTALLAPAVALLLACAPASVVWSETIPDVEMTAEEFDDTIDFEAADDAEEAYPPTPVHEVDGDQVTAAGGKKVVDGENWLDADNYERNDILNLIEDAQPDNTRLVIDVSTGDVWQVPAGPLLTLPGYVHMWTGDEYYEMDEYYRGPRRFPLLTIGEFERITDVENRDRFQPILCVQPFGEIGYREIESRGGFQVIPSKTWTRKTPHQRFLQLGELQSVLRGLPQFQGEGNQVAFGVMVPGGSVYAMPSNSYRNLIGQGGVRAWTAFDIARLQYTLTPWDRQLRNTRIELTRAEP